MEVVLTVHLCTYLLNNNSKTSHDHYDITICIIREECCQLHTILYGIAPDGLGYARISR